MTNIKNIGHFPSEKLSQDTSEKEQQGSRALIQTYGCAPGLLQGLGWYLHTVTQSVSQSSMSQGTQQCSSMLHCTV